MSDDGARCGFFGYIVKLLYGAFHFGASVWLGTKLVFTHRRFICAWTTMFRSYRSRSSIVEFQGCSLASVSFSLLLSQSAHSRSPSSLALYLHRLVLFMPRFLELADEWFIDI